MTRQTTYRGVRAALVLASVLVLASAAHAGGTRIEKQLELAPGGSFSLDTSGGSVILTGDSADGVHVVVTSSRDDLESLYDFQWEAAGDEVAIRAKRRSKITGWFKSSGSMKWVISVPHDTQVAIDTSGGRISVSDVRGEVLLDTSGGGIDARNIDGTVNADTSGGGIEVVDIRGDAMLDTSGGGIVARGVSGSVDADTSGGPIKIHDAGGDIRADTSGGGIEILGAAGLVEAETSGGGITLTLAPGNAAGGSVESSGGSIHVTLDPAVAINLDAECSGGSVVTEIPVTVQGSVGKSRLNGTMNGGGETLRVRTSGGGIKIKSL